MVGKTSMVVYNLQLSFQSLKFILTLLKIRKNIPKTISMLMFTNKKVFFKNQDLLSLFCTWKETITISKVFSLKSSIFWAPTLMAQVLRPSFLVKPR